MANKSRSGKSDKAQYQGYKIEGRWRKNRQTRLEARVLRNEADDSALKTFEAGSKTYGRQKPGKKGWFHPQEAQLLREVNSEVKSVSEAAKIKLANLREIYEDKRPSAVRMKPIRPELPPTTAQQLLNIGVISAKRYKTFKQSLGRIRRR